MPIRCGAGAVTKAYCGTNEIVRGYCGENLFFSSTPPFAPNLVRVTKLTGTGTRKLGATAIGTPASFHSYGGRHSSSYLSALEQITVSGTTATRTLRTLSSPVGDRAYYASVGNLTSGLIFFGLRDSRSSPRNQNSVFKLDFNTAPANVTVTQLTHTGTAPRQHSCVAIGDLTSGFVFGGRTSWPPNRNDFYWYEVSGDNIVTTTMTKAGDAIPNISVMAIAGDKASGIIFGGFTTAPVGTFYRYTVSGSTITLKNLTVTGDAVHGRYASSMIGNANFGIIFGGSIEQSNAASQMSNAFRFYRVTGDAVNVTALTRVGDSISGRRYASMLADQNLQGGVIYSGDIGSNTGSNDIYRFDAIHADNPTQASATVTSLSSSGTQPSPNAQLSMAGTSTDSLMFGGTTSNTNFRNDFYRLVITSNTVNFTRLNVSGSIAGRSYPAMVGDSTNGVIFGGRDANAVFSDFNTFTRSGSALTVTTFAQTTIPARHSCGMVGDATTGIIYGGTSLTTGIAGVFNDFYRYTIGVSSVAITTLTKTGDAIVPRLSHGMVGSATAGAIYSGHPGSGGAYLTDFYTYSVSGNVVTLKKLTVIGDSRPGTLAFAMIGNETSGIIFGGWTGSVHLSTIYSYLVTGDYVYLKRLTTNSSTTRSYFGYAGSASDFTIFGGYNNRWHRLRSPARYTIT